MIQPDNTRQTAGENPNGTAINIACGVQGDRISPCTLRVSQDEKTFNSCKCFSDLVYAMMSSEPKEGMKTYS